MTIVEWLRRLDKWIEIALYYLAGLLLVVIAGIVFYSVVMRYVFNEPPLWADEAPRALSLWMVFIGVAVATKRGRNIRVTHFIDMVPPSHGTALGAFDPSTYLVGFDNVLHVYFDQAQLASRPFFRVLKSVGNDYVGEAMSIEWRRS